MPSAKNILANLLIRENRIKYLLWVVLFLVLSVSVYRSIRYTRQTGGTDLRCRTIGARLLYGNHSPYFYHWNPGDRVYYLDPNDAPARLCNGNVVTPAALVLVHPLSVFSYHIIRPAWTVIQYILFLTTLLLLCSKRIGTKELTILAILVTGFGLSNIWYYHVERGQIYILYALMLALMYRIYRSSAKWSHAGAGIVCGLFCYLRPIALITALPFLVSKQRRWLMGFAAGLAIGLFIFILPFQNSWQQYLLAMKEYGNEIINNKDTGPSMPAAWMPAQIEHSTNLRLHHNFPTAAIKTFYAWMEQVHLKISYPFSLLTYCVLVIIFLIGFRKQRLPSADKLFLFAFLLYIMLEMFIIANRSAYNQIQWVFPLFLLLKRWFTNYRILFLLFIAVALPLVKPASPRAYLFSEILFLVLLIFTVFAKDDLIKQGSSATS